MKQKRVISLLLMVFTLIGVGIPLTASHSAIAAQVSSRSIKMSDSTPSAPSVTYTFTFTTASAAQSMVIDFCGDSSIIGAACDTTTSPTTGLPSFTAASTTFTNVSGMSTWSKSSSTATTIKLTSSSSTAAGLLSFSLSGITNMNVARSFYARVYTYAAASPSYTSQTSLGTTADYGGFALSTANNIAVTATVQEALTFCVSGTTTASCASTTPANIALGSGSPVTLGTTLSTGNAYMLTSTNALSGASIAIKNSNTCGGLSRDGGTTCPIAPVGATATAFAGSDGKFGMYVATSTGQTGASVAPISPYDQGSSSKYAMDTTPGTGVTGTYGDAFASSTGPTSNALNMFTFGADTTPTTPAGVYTATMILVATGTF